ncbi:MAG TPA: hypothetical protein VGC47_06690 [Acidimicrobiia bacterium]
MHRMRSMLGALLATALVAGACGGSGGGPFPEGWFPVQAASDVGIGHYRVLVGVVGPDNSRLGSEGDPVTIEVAPEQDSDATQRAEGIYTSIVPGVGLYRAEFDFDVVGTWTVTVIPSSGPSGVTALTVREQTQAPALGSTAPSVASPTLDDLPIDELTTDPEPLDRLYEQSIDEALASGRKSVITFSTPAFCRTEACGPLLEVVKGVAPQHPDVNFVHVEVYTGFDDAAFSPDDPSFLAPSVVAFGLPSEPWIFVTDEQGTIIGRFEGVVASEELTALLAP